MTQPVFVHRERVRDLAHEIRSDGRLVAEARSVVVTYDYERGESITASDEIRRRARS